MSEQEKPDTDVEAHAKRFHAADDAEPKDDEGQTGSREEADGDDVEAHAKRFHGAD